MQCLLVEIFKVVLSLTVNKILKQQSTADYNLSLQANLIAPSVNSTYKGSNSLTYDAVLWNSLPSVSENHEVITKI